MPVRTFDGHEPQLHESARIDPAATVIGDVTIEADASVWPGAVLRGDDGHIHVRGGANVQDGAVCHEGADLGPYATVGHNAIVHGATVEERAMVGMGAIVLDGATVGERALVAAGSVVTEDTDVPPETLVAGTPASVVKQVPDSPWAAAGDYYVELARRHDETSDPVEQGED
ncbi:gamma carbonic anhydrase family protein [Halomarina oriensis]|uniref:Gamma carbonic anhydrase family protein n=1 Tax=Halomarina oriensis TaxID=671145 RepID=A0A6B0GR33_9EURY|nr:gamma carbonic anhydrase family protein [Halomarina oriensis]MWG35827.1 gamma carbonic anhydrase family protein [Halomarina oriensis]